MSNELKESIRQTVRESVNGSVNEQFLTEGLIDKVKSFFSRNEEGEVKNIIMRNGDRIAVLSFSESSNQYGFVTFDRKTNKKEQEETLNSKSEIKQKQKELKEQGFEVITNASTAKKIINTIMKIVGGFFALGGIISIGIAGWAVATGLIPAVLLSAEVTLDAILIAGGVWVVKRTSERSKQFKTDKNDAQLTTS